MKTDYLSAEKLARMLKNSKEVCVSIVVPLHPLMPDRKADAVEVRKAMSQALEVLNAHYSKKALAPILSAMEELFDQIDFSENADGLGMYVSASKKELVMFFSPVKEKVLVADSFDMRDWLYQLYFSQPYFLLMLSDKQVRLFKGIHEAVEEITDANFPLEHKEAYEYSKPSRGSSYVGHAFVKEFEKDKSISKEERMKDFFHRADILLNSYLQDDALVVLAGTEKDLAYFSSLTHHPFIAGKIRGNFSYNTDHDLGIEAFHEIHHYLTEKKDEVISDFEEKLGMGRGISGIYEIWKAAQEGRCLRLLVEKDYSRPGFLVKGDNYNLYLHRPELPHRILPDVISTLVSVVMDKNGEVMVTENGELKKHQHMAMITRY